MACFSGIDIGSQTSKGVIIRDGEVLVYHLLPSGINYGQTAQRLQEELLKKAGLPAEELINTVTTGHNTGITPFDNRHVADVLCCARGINHVLPSVRTIIDVQAQSSQVLRINEKGKVINFTVSEVCASGSGCFLEVIANVLQVALEDVGPLSLKSENPVTFTTGCAVFGESEAISRISEGIPKEDILAGVHKALASKLSALVDRVGLEEPCAISGGGGLNIGLIKSLEELKIKLLVPPQPNLVNALGAALIASEIPELKLQ
jgi:predicted CoA-substrate-specific enzyme activase